MSSHSTSIASNDGSNDCDIQENENNFMDTFGENPSMESDISAGNRKSKKQRMNFNVKEDHSSEFKNRPRRQEEMGKILGETSSKKNTSMNKSQCHMNGMDLDLDPSSSRFDDNDAMVVDESESESESNGNGSGNKSKNGDPVGGEATAPGFPGFRRVDLRIDTSSFSPREEDVRAPSLKNAATNNNSSRGESLEKGFFGDSITDDASPEAGITAPRTQEEDVQEERSKQQKQQQQQQQQQDQDQDQEADHDHDHDHQGASFCSDTIMREISSKLDDKLNNTHLVTKKLLQEMTVFVRSLESIDSNYNRIRELEMAESQRIDGVEPDVNDANGLVVASVNETVGIGGVGGGDNHFFHHHHTHSQHQDTSEGVDEENDDADGVQQMPSNHCFRGHSSSSKQDLRSQSVADRDHQPLTPVANNYACNKRNDRLVQTKRLNSDVSTKSHAFCVTFASVSAASSLFSTVLIGYTTPEQNNDKRLAILFMVRNRESPQIDGERIALFVFVRGLWLRLDLRRHLHRSCLELSTTARTIFHSGRKFGRILSAPSRLSTGMVIGYRRNKLFKMIALPTTSLAMCEPQSKERNRGFTSSETQVSRFQHSSWVTMGTSGRPPVLWIEGSDHFPGSVCDVEGPNVFLDPTSLFPTASAWPWIIWFLGKDKNRSALIQMEDRYNHEAVKGEPIPQPSLKPGSTLQATLSDIEDLKICTKYTTNNKVTKSDNNAVPDEHLWNNMKRCSDSYGRYEKSDDSALLTGNIIHDFFLKWFHHTSKTHKDAEHSALLLPSSFKPPTPPTTLFLQAPNPQPLPQYCVHQSERNPNQVGSVIYWVHHIGWRSGWRLGWRSGWRSGNVMGLKSSPYNSVQGSLRAKLLVLGDPDDPQNRPSYTWDHIQLNLPGIKLHVWE
eukprot:jgi/Psemu1/15571/gm1.15571_g